jgi:integrase
MRGSILPRGQLKRGLHKGEYAWSLILPLGRDPVTKKQKQKWVTFHGSRKQAEAKLGELTGEVYRGDFVEPSKLTVGEWLDEWLDKAIKPPRRTASTYRAFNGILRNHLKPALGPVLLQQLTLLHVERYYAEMALRRAPNTLASHHAVLRTALAAAVNGGYVRTNVAARATNKPKAGVVAVSKNVWTIEEARQFMTTLKQHSNVQYRALYALALDTGMRKAELLGLKWHDLSGSSLRVERQLLCGGVKPPVFSLPKTKRTRVIDLSNETLALLSAHKRQQAELKMANRTRYKDHGLIFAQAWDEGCNRAALGSPLNLISVWRRLTRLCDAAKVRRINVHGLRHTCATLMLAAGVPPHVVQKRLGHSNIAMTLGVYSHVLPSQQADAADRLAQLLNG